MFRHNKSALYTNMHNTIANYFTFFILCYSGLPLCMDTENAIASSSSETTQETNIANANFGSRDIIFYLYLVVVVGIFGAFAGSYMTQIVWKYTKVRFK